MCPLDPDVCALCGLCAHWPHFRDSVSSRLGPFQKGMGGRTACNQSRCNRSAVQTDSHSHPSKLYSVQFFTHKKVMYVVFKTVGSISPLFHDQTQNQGSKAIDLPRRYVLVNSSFSTYSSFSTCILCVSICTVPGSRGQRCSGVQRSRLLRSS
jgi:hypothetical protein